MRQSALAVTSRAKCAVTFWGAISPRSIPSPDTPSSAPATPGGQTPHGHYYCQRRRPPPPVELVLWRQARRSPPGRRTALQRQSRPRQPQIRLQRQQHRRRRQRGQVSYMRYMRRIRRNEPKQGAETVAYVALTHTHTHAHTHAHAHAHTHTHTNTHTHRCPSVILFAVKLAVPFSSPSPF